MEECSPSFPPLSPEGAQRLKGNPSRCCRRSVLLLSNSSLEPAPQRHCFPNDFSMDCEASGCVNCLPLSLPLAFSLSLFPCVSESRSRSLSRTLPLLPIPAQGRRRQLSKQAFSFPSYAAELRVTLSRSLSHASFFPSTSLGLRRKGARHCQSSRCRAASVAVAVPSCALLSSVCSPPVNYPSAGLALRQEAPVPCAPVFLFLPLLPLDPRSVSRFPRDSRTGRSLLCFCVCVRVYVNVSGNAAPLSLPLFLIYFTASSLALSLSFSLFPDEKKEGEAKPLLKR